MKKTIFVIIAAISVLSVLAIALTPVFGDEPTGSVISNGAEYSLMPTASAAYPDTDGKLLTDGKHGEKAEGKTNYYSSGQYVGFNASTLGENGEIVIIIDLGKSYDDLSAFSLGYLNETAAGIYAPKSVSFAVSDERNGTYNELGTLDTSRSTDANLSDTYVSTLATDPVSGRYVRATVKALMSYADEQGEEHTAAWTFIDEISVYSADESGESSNDSSDDSSEVSDDSSEVSDDSSLDSSADDSSDAVSDTSSEDETSQPPLGDSGTSYIVLAFAAISALALAIALFTRRKSIEG